MSDYVNLWMLCDLATPEAILRRCKAAQEIGLKAAAAESRLEGMIAVVPIRGVMERRGGLFSALFGDSTHEGVIAAGDALAANDAVQAIVLDVDSPGGDADGLDEAGRAIRDAIERKPVIAQVN